SPANFKDSTAFSARCAPHLRRCGGGRRPRRCAHGAPLFVWIPAYVGTTTYLSPAKFKESAAFSWRCATHLRRSGGGRSPGRCAHGAPFFVYRGRGAVSLLPALRTVRAVLPHTALRSVVIYIEIGVQERELARG